MSDVTFGVKVSEEMKQELSELMKNTQLTGKEFMNLLIKSYRLEKEKENEHVNKEDVIELQRLLQRIQHLFINNQERQFFAKEMLEEEWKKNNELIEKETQELENALKEAQVQNEHIEIEKLEMAEKNTELEAQINLLKEENKLKQQQIIQQLVLEEKYAEEIERLKQAVTKYSRFEIELEEKCSENTKILNRNDELASEIWFLQREVEKLKHEHSLFAQQKDDEFQHLKNQYELEQKNIVLEQKLILNQKLEVLKEKHYEEVKSYQEKIQQLLEKTVQE
ncbi:MAG: hypothetical protein ACRCSG_05200 [Cellulosilyticaceae bacterium]